jgi:hypothetical protein
MVLRAQVMVGHYASFNYGFPAFESYKIHT